MRIFVLVEDHYPDVFVSIVPPTPTERAVIKHVHIGHCCYVSKMLFDDGTGMTVKPDIHGSPRLRADKYDKARQGAWDVPYNFCVGCGAKVTQDVFVEWLPDKEPYEAS